MARARPHVLGLMDSGHTHTLTPEASGCGEVGKDCAGRGLRVPRHPRRADTSARPGHREGTGGVKGGCGARRRPSGFYFKSPNSEHSKNGVAVPGALLLATPSRRAPVRPSHEPPLPQRPAWHRARAAGGRGFARDVASRAKAPPPGPYIRLGRAFALAQVERGSRARVGQRLGLEGEGEGEGESEGSLGRKSALGADSRQCRAARRRWNSCGLSLTSRPPAPKCASRRWARLAARTRRRSGLSNPPRTRSRRSLRRRCSRPPSTTITTTRTRGRRSRGLSSTLRRGSATAGAKCWER